MLLYCQRKPELLQETQWGKLISYRQIKCRYCFSAYLPNVSGISKSKSKGCSSHCSTIAKWSSSVKLKSCWLIDISELRWDKLTQDLNNSWSITATRSKVVLFCKSASRIEKIREDKQGLNSIYHNTIFKCTCEPCLVHQTLFWSEVNGLRTAS